MGALDGFDVDSGCREVESSSCADQTELARATRARPTLRTWEEKVLEVFKIELQFTIQALIDVPLIPFQRSNLILLGKKIWQIL